MGSGVQAGAAVARSAASFGGRAGSPSIAPSIGSSNDTSNVPWAIEFADNDKIPAGRCPEIDCVRSLLAADVVEAAQRRAAALGVGADRVLIAAGALSEEAICTRSLARSACGSSRSTARHARYARSTTNA
jgi:hypothetical protein